MASDPMTSWQIDGERMETVTDFILLGSKITGFTVMDCSHEIERYLLLGRKAMKNLDSVFKSRDITLPTKIHIVKTMVFNFLAAVTVHSDFGAQENKVWNCFHFFPIPLP